MNPTGRKPEVSQSTPKPKPKPKPKADPKKILPPPDPDHYSRVKSGYSSLPEKVISVLSYCVNPLFDKPSDFCNPGAEMKSWMSRIYRGDKGDTPISRCMMIGSHDAASHKVVGPSEKWQRNQSCDIGKQLEAGVRYLDIRLTINDRREFIVHHSSGLGDLAKKEFETPLKKFLETNCDEVVWVKLQFPKELTKKQVLHYLDNNFRPILQNHACLNKTDAGVSRGPGSITFNQMREKRKSLIVTVSDEHLKKEEKLTQEELGEYVWHHGVYAIDKWPHTPYPDKSHSFNETKVLPEIADSREANDGRLSILQMQTSPDIFNLFGNKAHMLKNGYAYPSGLASEANPAMQKVIKEWYQANGFSPNVVLQDFVGHYGYDAMASMQLAINTMDLDNSKIKGLFPELSKSILQSRSDLKKH